MHEIQSSRLLLKKIGNEDFEFFQSFLSVMEHTRFLPMGGPYSMEQIQKFFIDRIEHWKRYHFGTYMIHWPSTNQKIGYCGLEHVRGQKFIQVLYGLIQSQWQQGFASEAAWKCIHLGFQQIKLPIIYGVTAPQNFASAAILKKLGMTPDSVADFYGKEANYYSIEWTTYLENSKTWQT
ncbi:MAG: GNAT family N-acetyltransferase [SAR324 cluster bacterium]|nr:GNAT family N-acetyltransferase [SAR324 cluster bacterium]